MSEKTEKRRADLRARILHIAEARVAAGGLQALKARDLAQEAGCAVGAIYTVFDDITGVALGVNARTFRRLGQAVAEARAARPEDNPVEALVTMAKAYLAFAAANTRHWRALFDFALPHGDAPPDWYQAELAQLFVMIATPLKALHPHKPLAEIDLLTRALFSSVHGIVLLGLEGRASGVPKDDIETMLETVLGNFAGVRNS